MKLIVGLGNPGPEYTATRHNAGFRVVDAFVARYADAFGAWQKKFSALVAEGNLRGTKIAVMKPQTFMNASGDAVIEAIRFWKIKPHDIIVVSDDLDLDFGTLRIRQDGGSGGHNGLASIIEHLGTQDVPRLRIGIGKNHDIENNHRIPAEDYVLQHFTDEEENDFQNVLPRACEALATMIATII